MVTPSMDFEAGNQSASLRCVEMIPHRLEPHREATDRSLSRQKSYACTTKLVRQCRGRSAVHRLATPARFCFAPASIFMFAVQIDIPGRRARALVFKKELPTYENIHRIFLRFLNKTWITVASTSHNNPSSLFL